MQQVQMWRINSALAADYSLFAVLRKNPIDKARFTKGRYPDVVPDGAVFRVARVSSNLSDGSNQFSGFGYRNHGIPRAMKRPDRQCRDAEGSGRISCAAQRNGGCKKTRSLHDHVPCAYTPVGLTGNINAAAIDVKFRPDGIQYSQNQKHLGAEPIKAARDPISWTLGDQDEGWMFRLVLRFGPGMGTRNLILGDLCQIIRPGAACSMQPQNKRVLLVLVIIGRDKQTVRHALPRSIRVGM